MRLGVLRILSVLVLQCAALASSRREVQDPPPLPEPPDKKDAGVSQPPAQPPAQPAPFQSEMDKARTAMEQAVGAFRLANPQWRNDPRKGVGSPRLSGPGVDVAGLPKELTNKKETLDEAMAAVVKAYAAELGIQGLTIGRVTGSKAGNIWFLRGTPFLGKVEVVGRVDVGIAVDGKLVMMSSRVPPGIAVFAQLPEVRSAEPRTFQRADVDPKRMGEATPILWWDVEEDARPVPKLYYRYEVRGRPGDSLGGTYIVEPSGEIFRPSVTRKGSPVDAGTPRGHAPPPTLPADRGRAPVGCVDLLVQATVRIEDPTGTALQPMPDLVLEVVKNGAVARSVCTGANGTVPLVLAAGETLQTSFCGGTISAMCTCDGTPVQAALQFGATDDGSVTTATIDGTAPHALDAATAHFWCSRAARRFQGVIGQMEKLDSLKLQCLVSCGCDASWFQPPDMLNFTGVDTLCPLSRAVPTLVLHEWGHALDYACDYLKAEALDEAWADIVAMFVSECEGVGGGLAGQVYLRSGMNDFNPKKHSFNPNGHGYAGDHLMGFAWKVRLDILQCKNCSNARDWVDSMFLGLVAGDPDSIEEFVERLVAADQPRCPGGHSHADIIDKWLQKHGLGAPAR